jgi:hypothetical protein
MSKPVESFTQWATHAKKRVYLFHEGNGTDKELLGLKGADLCEMTRSNNYSPLPLFFFLSLSMTSDPDLIPSLGLDSQFLVVVLLQQKHVLIILN